MVAFLKTVVLVCLATFLATLALLVPAHLRSIDESVLFISLEYSLANM